MKLLEIVMKDCQEAKLGRETVKLTLSLMMNQKLRLKYLVLNREYFVLQ